MYNEIHYNQTTETKDKEIILKATREKQLIPYKSSSIRYAVNFSSETMEARRQGNNIFEVLEEK